MSEKGNSKVKQLFTEVKTHWKVPAKGKYVPYRDITTNCRISHTQ